MSKRKNLVGIAFNMQDKLLSAIIDIMRYNKEVQSKELTRALKILLEVLESINGFRP